MKKKYEDIVRKCEVAYETVALMEQIVLEHDQDIKDLKVEKKSLKGVVENLDKSLEEKRCALLINKTEMVDDYEKQVQIWRKELGNVQKKHKQLYKKLDYLEKDSTFVHNDHKIVQEPILEKDSVSCSICEADISNYATEYFCGEVIPSTCHQCKEDANLAENDMTLDPFSSFHMSEMPISMNSHWICSYVIPNLCLVSLPSLTAYYVRAPSPGEKFLSMKEIIVEMEAFMEKQRREGCKQS